MEINQRDGCWGIWCRDVCTYRFYIDDRHPLTQAPRHSSAADEISGETVAIKLVTRVFEKVQLAKRALRELTLLRHFTHENITGLIDVDAITPDFNEM